MRYALQRFVQFLIVFIVVTFVVMLVTRIGSKDIVRDLAGGAVSDQVIDKVNADYPYLDKPIPVQYGYWLKDMVTGDMGFSYAQEQSVREMFVQRLPSTTFIGFWAIMIGLMIAIPLGVYSVYNATACSIGAAALPRSGSSRRRRW